MSKFAATDAFLKEIRALGLSWPGTSLKSPWPDHLDLAVKDKTFAYLSLEGQPFGISCKLPRSSDKALMLPFCQPAGYGLGKSGWVDARFAEGEMPPVDLIKDWLEESYRAQAPKTFVKQLDAMRASPSSSPSLQPAQATQSFAKKAKQKAKSPPKKAKKKKARR